MKPGLFFILFLMISTALTAQERGTGFEMLNFSPSSYALSRAEATVSIADGAASIYSNPALLIYNAASSIDLGYTFWLGNTPYIFGGLNLKNKQQAIAFAFYTAGASDYNQYDSPGTSNGTFSIRHLSISAAYAYDFSYFSMGAAFQYLREENYSYRASGYAFNLGIAGKLMDGRIRTGASLKNIGEMETLIIDATTLPANATMGFSADVFEISAEKNKELPILISVFADYVVPLNENDDYLDYIPSSPHFNLGLSLNIAEVVEVSGGFKPTDDAQSFSFGASFIADNIRFNYALIPFKTGFGTVHSVGLQYQF